MSDVKEPSHAPRDPDEELVFLYLEEREEGLVKNVDEFARRHTSTSDAVRERIAALERAGLMGSESRADFPERLGNFRLLERLGGGGMGVVYVAEELTLRRRVALKLIRPEQVYFGQAKERFRREVEAVAKLSHPGIVQIFSFAEEGGVPFFAMELVEGAALGDVLAQLAGHSPSSLSGADLARAVTARCSTPCANAPLFDGTWVRSCLEIARQIAVALEHAHARGVVHRDIKPSNVMITPDGRARLLDFGLASRVGATRLTRTGAQLGSMPYMPPELALGRTDEAGPRTDVYSLGVTLYESLALSLPFADESSALLVQRIAAGRPESVRRANPDVSLDAETICKVAMELDPERRYATAGALASDLAAVLERRPIAARRTSRWIHARRWVERNPGAATAAALGALLAIGGPLGYGALQARAAEKERGLNADLREANQTVTDVNSSLQTAKSELEQKNADLAGALVRERELTAQAGRNFGSALDAIAQVMIEVGADDLRPVPGFDPIRKKLLERALKFYERLQEDVPGNIDVEREIARTTRSIGDVLDNLGQGEEAIAHWEKAIELADRVVQREPNSVNSRHVYCGALLQLANKHLVLGHVDEARDAFEEVLPIAEQLVVDDPWNARMKCDLATTLMDLGGIYMMSGNSERALLHRRRSVEVLRPALLGHLDETFFAIRLAMCLNGLSNCESNAGNHAQGLACLREAWSVLLSVEETKTTRRELRDEFVAVAVNYGLALTAADPAEAERVLRKGFEAGRSLAADFPEDLTVRNNFSAVACNLGYHLTNQAKWPEALEALEEAVRQGEVVLQRDGARPDFRASLATSIGCRSTVLLGLGRVSDARADAERGVAIFGELRRTIRSHPLILSGSAACLMQRAEVERAEGDWRKALATTQEAVALGLERSDLTFQAFETYWHIAQVADTDATLAADESARTVANLVDLALDQLANTIQQGFGDRKRLETFADYAGLREEPRFQELVTKLGTQAK
ncbi:MAG TPA: protein kinase [Planctomycetota bacterium]|nr:protein kinase [Planctomycetota bacterium]